VIATTRCDSHWKRSENVDEGGDVIYRLGQISQKYDITII